MKKIKSFIVAVMIFSGLGVLAACQDSSNESKNEKTIVIGTTGQSFPNSYFKDGKLTGFDIDVSEAIAKQLGLNIKWITSDFSGLMGQLEAGRLDTVANVVAITPLRQLTYNFSIPYSYYASQIVTFKDNPYEHWQDFKGKTIAGVLGSNHIRNLDRIFPKGTITIRTYETRDSAMMDAVKNRVDGYVNSRPILAVEINRHNLPLKYVDKPLIVEAVGFPFAKNKQGEMYLEAFNKAIQSLNNMQVLHKLSEQYYGEDIIQPPEIYPSI